MARQAEAVVVVGGLKGRAAPTRPDPALKGRPRREGHEAHEQRVGLNEPGAVLKLVLDEVLGEAAPAVLLGVPLMGLDLTRRQRAGLGERDDLGVGVIDPRPGFGAVHLDPGEAAQAGVTAQVDQALPGHAQHVGELRRALLPRRAPVLIGLDDDLVRAQALAALIGPHPLPASLGLDLERRAPVRHHHAGPAPPEHLPAPRRAVHAQDAALSAALLGLANVGGDEAIRREDDVVPTNRAAAQLTHSTPGRCQGRRRPRSTTGHSPQRFRSRSGKISSHARASLSTARSVSDKISPFATAWAMSQRRSKRVAWPEKRLMP